MCGDHTHACYESEGASKRSEHFAQVVHANGGARLRFEADVDVLDVVVLVDLTESSISSRPPASSAWLPFLRAVASLRCAIKM